MRRAKIAVAAVVLATWSTVSVAQSIAVAAAADLTSGLTALAGDYQKQTGREVKLSFGASGTLTSQIENGAPFDLFFSADESYPRQLIQDGLADPGSLYRYARGTLIIWTSAGASLNIEDRGYQVLLDPGVTKIAMANPQHAPYGRSAEAALRHWGIYDKILDRLVLGENIAQTAQFVESGNAQVGLLALSTAMAPSMRGKGKYWIVPQDAYPPLDQAVVVLSGSRQKAAAAEFLVFLKKPASVDLLKSYGFTGPAASRAKEKR